MNHILIIDDDEDFCELLARTVRNMGHQVRYALTLGEGLRQISKGAYDVVFLDVRLPDGSGLDRLKEIQRLPTAPEIIIVTGAGDPEGAELAIKSGVWDYMEKGVSVDNMRLPLERALQYRREKARAGVSVALRRDHIKGESPAIGACLDLVAQSAASRANVLISGETGTGKELFARAIHLNSPRSHGNFVVVDCATLPETLVESTLFGHVKGAFTGAQKDSPGLVKEAHGGTLFLDEVGELPAGTQKSFLRVLQERRFRPVGGTGEAKSDFRLLSATNRHLDQMAEDGQFRKDLLYRLRTVSLELPALRTIPEDIQGLALHYMVKFCEREGIESKGFSQDFLDTLMAYDWPGNIRELVNAVESALALARHEPTLFSKHLPPDIRIKTARASLGEKTDGPSQQIISKEDRPIKDLPPYRDFRESALSNIEKDYFEQLMRITGGRIKEAGRLSGLGRTRLYTLFKKHGITRPPK